MKLESLDIKEKVNTVIEKRKENKILQFILGFCQLVERLFIFIESIRTRNWIQHRNAAESLLPDYASLNRLKYRRMWTVYVADMLHLEQDDPAMWRW